MNLSHDEKRRIEEEVGLGFIFTRKAVVDLLVDDRAGLVEVDLTGVDLGDDVLDQGIVFFAEGGAISTEGLVQHVLSVGINIFAGIGLDGFFELGEISGRVIGLGIVCKHGFGVSFCREHNFFFWREKMFSPGTLLRHTETPLFFL